MARRSKKAQVRPELRTKWLRRYEEGGESPPDIARLDGYDVRTVRKQIEIARREREVREARTMVLRDAVQEHHRDLVDAAHRIDSAISWPPNHLSPAISVDRMTQALKEHVPRSQLWKVLEQWGQLIDQYRTNVKRVEIRSRTEAKKHRLKLAESTGQAGLGNGFAVSIIENTIDIARGHEALENRATFSVEEQADRDLALVKMGSFNLGIVPVRDASMLKDRYLLILRQSSAWEENVQLNSDIQELERLSELIHDELAIITLKRVVPGRCKYCPA